MKLNNNTKYYERLLNNTANQRILLKDSRPCARSMQQPHTLLLRHPIGHRPRLPQSLPHWHQATRLRRLPHHFSYLRQLPQLRSNQRPRLTIYFVEIILKIADYSPLYDSLH